MVILGKPKNIENYIIVKSEIANKLHQMGFIPVYRNNDDIYFIKTDELEKFISILINETE